jgi:urease accessory protein UreF
MLDQTYNVPHCASEILGDLTALAEQLGGADGLCQLPVAAASLDSAKIDSVSALRRFLGDYTSRILIPHELPAIAQAYGHVNRYEIRELLALDRALAQEPVLRALAHASRSVGFAQLQRLRPLRGERVVQRYLNAVESSEANAWHTLVFGLVLALYSLPLRQGLLHYSQQTLGGFTRAAGGRIALPVADRQSLLDQQLHGISVAIEQMLAPSLSAPE